MTDIVQSVHDCVSNDDEYSSEIKLIKDLSDGEYLTFERHQGLQCAIPDARTPSSKLKGLIPQIEDFHA